MLRGKCWRNLKQGRFVRPSGLGDGGGKRAWLEGGRILGGRRRGKGGRGLGGRVLGVEMVVVAVVVVG